jgi:hypothetical protein
MLVKRGQPEAEGFRKLIGKMVGCWCGKLEALKEHVAQMVAEGMARRCYWFVWTCQRSQWKACCPARVERHAWCMSLFLLLAFLVLVCFSFFGVWGPNMPSLMAHVMTMLVLKALLTTHTPHTHTVEAEAAAKSTTPADEAADKQPPSTAASARTTPAPSDASSPEDASDAKDAEVDAGDESWRTVVLHTQVGWMSGDSVGFLKGLCG